ncbi:MAG: aldolase/citrate lyase family protein [Candidatus Magasanikbacteria bacterium]
MRQNLKEKLAQGKNILGTWCELPSPEVVNVISKAGLDFVIIDMEHGSMSFERAGQMVMAAQVEGCCPLIRVSRNDESDILRALEIGSSGILVPHISSVAERKKVVHCAKFAPIGNRSFNPYIRAGGYGARPFDLNMQNDELLTAIMIEDKDGIEMLKEIISDDNIDMVYIGAYDLSVALGVSGDTSNKKVLNELENMVKIIRATGKSVGCMFHSDSELEFYKNIGVQFLCYKVDTGVIFDEFLKIKKLV